MRSKLLALILSFTAVGPVAASDIVEIPFQRHVLDNGLTLLLHEDHKAPIVAVNVWYHVGSKNELPGRTGFAHLFEHLMFNGSEHFDDYYRVAFDRVGATGMNGTTNFDRTNYFETVPTTALDFALFLESDRMGHLLGVVTEEKLDQEKGAVQNEKRQREGQPYGKAFSLLFENSYPEGHPYSWSIIGSMDDLSAATLEDVHAWFETWYGPANAVLSIAGDIDPDVVIEKVERYFGDLPPGPTLTRPGAWVAKRTGSKRILHEDRVPQARIYRTWNVGEFGHPQNTDLDLLAGVLAEGKTSRLFQRLVYEDQIATDASAFLYEREIGSMFVVVATAHPNADVAEVEAALDEELAKILETGPSADEVARMKARRRASFVRGVERIGGFGGTSDVLASGEVYAGDPGWYQEAQKRLAASTPTSLMEAARAWLSDGDLTLAILPRPEFAAKETDVDRSVLPEPEGFPEGRFPEVQEGHLENGVRVLVAERTSVPVVQVSLLLDAGFAGDQGRRLGTADLTLEMLDEGAGGRTGPEISDALDLMGARLSAGSNADGSWLDLSALKENLDESLDLMADVALRPDFPEIELARLKKEQLARIGREKVEPTSMALRVLPRLLYGDGHAYSLPLTGSGTEESVAAMTQDDLRAFHDDWFRPDVATLIVVGDTTLDEILPLLETRFGAWKSGPVPTKNLAAVERPAASTVYLMDRPDSPQSSIFAAQVMPPRGGEDDLKLEVANLVLGGSATSRLNNNLRRDKHWSYGAFSILIDARGPRPLVALAPVQSDKTVESLAEIAAEIRGIAADVPPKAEEVAVAKDKQTLTLPGRWETARSIVGSLKESVQFDLADDYWDEYSKSVRALDQEGVARAAADGIDPGRMIYVVVGDRSKIEAGIRELGLGDVIVLDADGKPLE